MPLQSQDGWASCMSRTTSFNTSSSGASDATSSSTPALKSSRSPVISLIDGILPYTERLPPMITSPQRDVPKPHLPCRGGSRTAPALTREEPRRVPHQDDAVARRVLRHADQLPAVSGSLVDRRLQSRLRRASSLDFQRRVLRVVALGLRSVRSVSLSLGHLFLLPCHRPAGKQHAHDATGRGQAHPPEPVSHLLLQRYSLLWIYGSNARKKPSC